MRAATEGGWGDNPFIFLDCARTPSLRRVPRYNIEQGSRLTLRWLRDNPGVLGLE
jgi:hypothetical protein